MGFFAFMTVFERKLIGRMQTRHGPNRVGPKGLLQPIADLGKLIRKQNMIPEGAHRRLYLPRRSSRCSPRCRRSR